MRAVILDAATLGDATLNSIVNNGDDWQLYSQTEPHQVEERINGAEIVLTNKVVMTDQAIQKQPQLRLIMITATGTNNVDLQSATDHGVTVCNVRGYGSASVAQHVMALMLNLATKMPQYFTDVKQGEWTQRHQVTLIHRPIFELAGKRLGIVGYGQLGQAVAELARAFGMEVLIAARSDGDPREDRVPFQQLLPQIDFLSLHCPLDDNNHHLINTAALDLMPTHSYLINTARGGLVDGAALLDALGNQSIAGAALDVLPVEPPEQNEPLIKATAQFPNLLITPHNAWGALESRQRLVEQVAEVISQFHQGNPMNVVTP